MGSSFSLPKEPEMLLRNEITHASDVELLTVILGRRQTAETLLKQAGSLFALLFETRHDNGKFICAQGSSGRHGRVPPRIPLQPSRNSSRNRAID